jgi:AcrR family transcriptional regulator
VSAAIDGRVQRSRRSRAAIVQALFDLVGEGVVQPTAQQVAARARVGIRSVFRHFSDMESLYAEIDERVRARALPLFRAPTPEGGVAARARALVRRRARLFEQIAPYKRAGGVLRWSSRFIAANHVELARGLRADLLRALPELRDGSTERIEALDAALSFEFWDRLRTDQRLGRGRAVAALEAVVKGLLALES